MFILLKPFKLWQGALLAGADAIRGKPLSRIEVHGKVSACRFAEVCNQVCV